MILVQVVCSSGLLVLTYVTFTKMNIKKIIDKHILCAHTFLFCRKMFYLFFLNLFFKLLFVNQLDRCLYSKYSEFNQKVNGNGFITLIKNKKFNTASNMINEGIIKYLYVLKHYDGRSMIIF